MLEPSLRPAESTTVVPVGRDGSTMTPLVSTPASGLDQRRLSIGGGLP